MHGAHSDSFAGIGQSHNDGDTPCRHSATGEQGRGCSQIRSAGRDVGKQRQLYGQSGRRLVDVDAG
jgi:hypothetical protein